MSCIKKNPLPVIKSLKEAKVAQSLCMTYIYLAMNHEGLLPGDFLLSLRSATLYDSAKVDNTKICLLK